LNGQLSSSKERKAELETQCKDKFDAPLSGLPAMKTEFETVLDTEIGNAEKVLGISGGIAETDEPQDGEDPDGPLV
jgi:hypothetical protein